MENQRGFINIAIVFVVLIIGGLMVYFISQERNQSIAPTIPTIETGQSVTDEIAPPPSNTQEPSITTERSAKPAQTTVPVETSKPTPPPPLSQPQTPPQTKSSCLNRGGSSCQEYEVCAGTVVSANDTPRCCQGQCKLPKTFSWRNRHGENWNTPVKDQGAVPYCTQFGPTASIEAVINLYYNQHLDLDLSEQISNSCGDTIYQTAKIKSDGTHDYETAPAGPCYNVNNPADIICKAKVIGIPDENCYPYVNYYDPNKTFVCNNLCSDYQQRLWKVADFGQLLPPSHMRASWDPMAARVNQESISEEKVKQYIVLFGPLAVSYHKWKHVMSLIGWETSEAGQAQWLVKNSWGSNWEDNGYGKITESDINNFVIGYIKPPIYSPINQNYQINCVDKDRDNFCNWGISPSKPSSCPVSCKNEKDWDDNNPNIGALGVY
jgi:C1A family cysteine protease